MIGQIQDIHFQAEKRQVIEAALTVMAAGMRASDNHYLRDKAVYAFKSKVFVALQEILQANQDNNSQLCVQLKSFLDKAFKLWPCYTALPDDDVTLLLCEVARLVQYYHNKKLYVEQGEDFEPAGILQFLMPGVCTDSIDLAHYPHLEPPQKNGKWVNIDIREVLRTHILCERRNFLIPVKQLTTLKSDTVVQPRENPYFDVFEHDKSQVFISTTEMQRLYAHAPETHKLHDALQALQQAQKQENTLLGNLNQLIASFRYNSIDGIGSEVNAGVGGYQAILNFRDFYNRLGEKQSQIPEDVASLITRLFDVTFDSAKNRQATAFE